ncbi:MAG TPA: cation:proton antiporter [Actinophytocola sp.]|uniref:cation:proton antiporter n=1 Tax=Actinophytocola sp. TaxID=1872138 RepID=UPI002DDCE90E|nr:cation:proton antiporter [Actinophytocola sp.]HEV2783690.1 cation:proton antiporter [Actinophytocola sp.]
MTVARRSAALLVAVLAGVGVARMFDITAVHRQPSYELFVTALLGFGLYASTCGIDLALFRRHVRIVVLAVTLGVLAKAAIIFGIVYLVFRDPSYLVLGVAVAQIDPLSVAALRRKSKLSEQGKVLLAAWASFDDPITVLLTVYVTAFALRADGAGVIGAGLGSFAESLLWNLVLAGGAYLIWLAAKRFRRVRRDVPLSRFERFGIRTASTLVILVIAAVAVHFSLLLALAVIGLFFRPNVGDALDKLAEAAVLVATFAVGLVLAFRIDPFAGLVLGGAAYLSQILVGFVMTTPRQWRGDRWRLALGQQNGMTAIILALLLEPNFPGTIGIVAPAIFVVNVLHAVCNGVFDRYWPPVPVPQVQDQSNRLDRLIPRWQAPNAAARVERVD